MDLNAKNLCWGDWVYCTTDRNNYQFGRLTRNHDCHCSTDEKLNYNYDIQPIVLTIDMLVQNGFKSLDCFKSDGGEMYSYDDTDSRLLLYHSKINNTIGLSILNLEIKYVHELQHIMTLYGLNAENFKL